MKRRQSSRRRGTVLVCVLACLAVVAGLVGIALQFALRSHSEARVYRQRVQVEFLCEAGFIRAQNQLRLNPGYQGEVWLPKSFDGQLDLPRVPIIEIEVQRDAGESSEIIVNASLADPERPMEAWCQSHTFKIKNTVSKN